MLTAISSLATLGTAIAAFRTVNATRATAEAQLAYNFLFEYQSPEMLSALRTLRHWAASHGDNFATVWHNDFTNHEPQSKEVDLARRKVTQYFVRAVKLYQAGYTSQSFVVLICSLDGVNILHEVAEPLAAALDDNYDRSTFEDIYHHAKLGTAIP